jgi:hypothetical protein
VVDILSIADWVQSSMDFAALEFGPVPAHDPAQTKASVSTRITEYLSYEALPSGILVTAKIFRHTENPSPDISIATVLDEHVTTTMPWSSYKQCLGAKGQLEEKLESGWNFLEGLNAHSKRNWLIMAAKRELSHAKSRLFAFLGRSLS